MARSIAEELDRYARDNSHPVYVRARVEDVATVLDYIVRECDRVPASTGIVVSEALQMFAQTVINSGKGRRFELQEAKRYLELTGIKISGGRKNVRVTGCQLEPTTMTGVDPAMAREIERIDRELQERIFRERSCVEVSECTVPPQDDQLLAELEEGIKTGKVPVAE